MESRKRVYAFFLMLKTWGYFIFFREIFQGTKRTQAIEFAVVVQLLIMSDSLRFYGLQPTWLLCPRDSPGKNTGMGCHAILQRIFLTQGSNLRFSLAGEFFTTEPPGKPKLLNRNSNFQFEVLEGIQGYRTQNVAWDKKTYTLLYPKWRMRKDGYWMALCWAREQMECRRMSVEMVWERKWLRTCCRSMRPHQGFS